MEVVEGKQAAADRGKEAWPLLAAQEAWRVAEVEDERRLLALLHAGQRGAAVSLEAFEISSSPAERLTKINWHLRDMGALFGPLRPLY